MSEKENEKRLAKMEYFVNTVCQKEMDKILEKKETCINVLQQLDLAKESCQMFGLPGAFNAICTIQVKIALEADRLGYIPPQELPPDSILEN